ncbi:hypothetical protein COP1_014377 [Malus domestica]
MLIWRCVYNNIKREEIQKMFPVSFSENDGEMHTWISPLENPSLNVVPKLNDWVYNGNKIRVTELQRIIHDLRKRKCFSQAFQISKWMNQKGICIFSPVEHVVQLDLIGKHVIAGKLKLGRNIGSGSFEELYLGMVIGA